MNTYQKHPLKSVKRAIAILLLMLMTVANRAGNVECLTFNVNGSPVVIALSEHPVITYSNNALHIQTKSETVDIPVSQITGAVFEETTDIQRVIGSHTQISQAGIFFSQLPANSKVTVYASNGVEVTTAVANGNGQALVDIGGLPAGMYMVKSVKQTLKITTGNK